MKIQNLLSRWWPVGAGALLGVAAASLINGLATPTYVATATLFLGSPASTDSSGAYSGDLFSQQRAATYAKLVGNRDLATKVIDDLGISVSPEELSSSVLGAQVPRTVLMEVSATGSSAQGAADLSNAYAENLVTYISRLETPVDSNRPAATVTIIESARAPSLPQWPNYGVTTVIGAVLGVLAGLLVTWLRDKVVRTVRDFEQLATVTGVPVLGVLPREGGRLSKQASERIGSVGDYSEAIRELRTNFLYANVDAPPSTVAFVSPVSTVSTTAIMSNLAVALAAVGKEPVIVDADLRHPRLSEYLGDDSDKGLAEVLEGDLALEDAICQVPDTEVRVMFSGATSMAPGDSLASSKMSRTVESLGVLYDYAFFDTPGLLEFTDAAAVGLTCDATILVACAGRTKLRDLREAKENLDRLRVPVVGVVFAEAR